METILLGPPEKIWYTMLAIHEPEAADLQSQISAIARVSELAVYEHERIIALAQEC